MQSGTLPQTNWGVEVLVVDDKPGYAEVLARLLSRADDDFTVATESSGQAALDYIAANPVDCVASGAKVTDGTGLNLLTAVREMHPDVGCILLTNDDPAYLDVDWADAPVDVCYRKREGVNRFREVSLRIRSLANTVSQGGVRRGGCVVRNDWPVRVRR